MVIRTFLSVFGLTVHGPLQVFLAMDVHSGGFVALKRIHLTNLSKGGSLQLLTCTDRYSDIEAFSDCGD